MSDIHNIETEQALIGAILVQPDRLQDIAGILEPEHFYEPLHGQIFAAIRSLAADGRVVSPITVAPIFEDADPIGELTVPKYINRLFDCVVWTLTVRQYADVVKDLANRRALSDHATRLKQLAEDKAVDVAASATDGIKGLEDVIAESRHGRQTHQSLASGVKSLIAGFGKRPPAVPTSLADLDRIVHLRRGEYAILAGRPSMGKSAIAIQIMLNAAASGYGVGMFSLEMTADQLSARCLSSFLWSRHSSIPFSMVLNGKIPDGRLESLQNAAAKFESLPIEIDTQESLTVSQIASRARQQAVRFERDGRKLGLVIVDHLGKIKPSKRYAGNLVNETGEISAGVAAMAKELDVPVLALHQLNRAVESREEKRPQLSDLRNSGDIEQDADVVMFAYRDAYYLERTKFSDEEAESRRVAMLEDAQSELEIIIAKNRSGPCDVVEFFADIACNKILNKW